MPLPRARKPARDRHKGSKRVEQVKSQLCPFPQTRHQSAGHAQCNAPAVTGTQHTWESGDEARESSEIANDATGLASEDGALPGVGCTSQRAAVLVTSAMDTSCSA